MNKHFRVWEIHALFLFVSIFFPNHAFRCILNGLWFNLFNERIRGRSYGQTELYRIQQDLADLLAAIGDEIRQELI